MIGLAYFGGFTHSEIARMLSMPLGTVKGRMRLGWRRSGSILPSACPRPRLRGAAVSGQTEPRGIHEELRDDLAAYALGALPVEEADAIATHLRGCDACASHVEWLQPRRRPAARFGRRSCDPPPRLKGALMAEVKADVKSERKQASAAPAAGAGS